MGDIIGMGIFEAGTVLLTTAVSGIIIAAVNYASSIMRQAIHPDLILLLHTIQPSSRALSLSSFHALARN